MGTKKNRPRSTKLFKESMFAKLPNSAATLATAAALSTATFSSAGCSKLDSQLLRIDPATLSTNAASLRGKPIALNASLHLFKDNSHTSHVPEVIQFINVGDVTVPLVQGGYDTFVGEYWYTTTEKQVVVVSSQQLPTNSALCLRGKVTFKGLNWYFEADHVIAQRDLTGRKP